LLTLALPEVVEEVADIATIKDFILIPDTAVASVVAVVQLTITRRHTVQVAAAALVLTDRAITVLADHRPRAVMAPAVVVVSTAQTAAVDDHVVKVANRILIHTATDLLAAATMAAVAVAAALPPAAAGVARVQLESSGAPAEVIQTLQLNN
jgi:hypothetical protein